MNITFHVYYGMRRPKICFLWSHQNASPFNGKSHSFSRTCFCFSRNIECVCHKSAKHIKLIIYKVACTGRNARSFNAIKHLSDKYVLWVAAFYELCLDSVIHSLQRWERIISESRHTVTQNMNQNVRNSFFINRSTCVTMHQIMRDCRQKRRAT